MPHANENDPRHHVQNVQRWLNDVTAHLREDIEKVDEPQLKAMFETSAEVLTGLTKAFQDYQDKNEPAWQASAQRGDRSSAPAQRTAR